MTGYVHSKVLKKVNPLELSIRVPAPPTANKDKSTGPIPSQAMYNRVLQYLGKLVEAEWRSKGHPVVSKYSRKELTTTFKNQFQSYSLLRYPFDKPLGKDQSVRSWWSSLVDHPDADILAVSIIDILLQQLYLAYCTLTVHREKAIFCQTKFHA